MDRLSGLIASPAEELLSFITAVRGVKSYEGLSDLAANKNLLVELIREKDNKYDSNAVLVKTRSDYPKKLGHLEKRQWYRYNSSLQSTWKKGLGMSYGYSQLISIHYYALMYAIMDFKF